MEELDIDKVHQQIGKNIAELRKAKNISQLDLSLKLGHKSVSIVASAERFYKKRHFNIEHLIKPKLLVKQKSFFVITKLQKAVDSIRSDEKSKLC